MNTSKRSLDGPRRFQWNAGAWFGSSLGSSAWMIVTSYFLIVHNQPRLALAPATGFSVILLGSILLWVRRDRVYPFTALMRLLVLLVLTVPIVWLLVSKVASPDALAAMNWPVSGFATVVVCLAAPAIMVAIWLMEQTTPTRTSREERVA